MKNVRLSEPICVKKGNNPEIELPTQAMIDQRINNGVQDLRLSAIEDCHEDVDVTLISFLTMDKKGTKRMKALPENYPLRCSQKDQKGND